MSNISPSSVLLVVTVIAVAFVAGPSFGMAAIALFVLTAVLRLLIRFLNYWVDAQTEIPSYDRAVWIQLIRWSVWLGISIWSRSFQGKNPYGEDKAAFVVFCFIMASILLTGILKSMLPAKWGKAILISFCEIVIVFSAAMALAIVGMYMMTMDSKATMTVWETWHPLAVSHLTWLQ